MAKYHVNANGEAGPCKAEKGGCPFGGEAEHFTSYEAAREAYEERMEAHEAPSMTKAPVQTFVRKRVKTGQPSGVLLLESSLKKWTSYGVTIRRAQFEKLAAEALKLRKKFDDPKLDSFEVAEKIMKQYSKEVKGKEFFEETTYAMNESAFSYVSPIVGGAAGAFEETLTKAGWETRGSSMNNLEFAKIYAQAAKRAGANASAEELATTFKEQARKARWNMNGASEDDVIAEASRNATYYVRMDREVYKNELDAIAEEKTFSVTTRNTKTDKTTTRSYQARDAESLRKKLSSSSREVVTATAE